MSRRSAGGRRVFCNREFMRAVTAYGRSSPRGPSLGIEPNTTCARHCRRVVAARQHVAAVWADHLRFWVAGLVSMRRKHVPGEQIDACTALGAGQNLHPEEVERLTWLPVTVLGPVETLDLASRPLFDLSEERVDFGPIDGTKSNTNRSVGNRIDVAANCGATELLRLSHRGAASHERVEHNQARQVERLVEEVHHGSAARNGSRNDRRPKHRSQPLRPPLVYVVHRSMDLFPPALDLRDVAHLLERKSVLYRASTSAREQWLTIRSAWLGYTCLGDCPQRRRGPVRVP